MKITRRKLKKIISEITGITGVHTYDIKQARRQPTIDWSGKLLKFLDSKAGHLCLDEPMDMRELAKLLMKHFKFYNPEPVERAGYMLDFLERSNVPELCMDDAADRRLLTKVIMAEFTMEELYSPSIGVTW